MSCIVASREREGCCIAATRYAPPTHLRESGDVMYFWYIKILYPRDTVYIHRNAHMIHQDASRRSDDDEHDVNSFIIGLN